MTRKLKTVELYCGAGLLGGGFAEREFEPVFAADLDPRAVSTYNEHMPPVARVWNVRKVIPALRCDVLVAGPPCQGFSTLGRRDEQDERNGLSLLVADWALSTRAKVVVVENVPQFVDSPYWKKLVMRLLMARFLPTVWVLDAYDYGVAQRRTRSFTVLSKIGFPRRPKTSPARMVVKDAFRGLGGPPSQEGMDVAPVPSGLALKRFLTVPRNGDKRDIVKNAPELCPSSWGTMGAQATDVYGRMNYDEPANTLRCCFQDPSKGRYIHPEEHRVITLREGARLQGVPDRWKFRGSRTSIAKQIGNGVPIPLAKAVAGSVAELFS